MTNFAELVNSREREANDEIPNSCDIVSIFDKVDIPTSSIDTCEAQEINVNHSISNMESLMPKFSENQLLTLTGSENLHENALIYIIGFVVFKMKHRLKCDNCTDYMSQSDEKSLRRDNTKLIQQRAFPTKSNAELGTYLLPSKNFEVDYKNIFEYFCNTFSNIKHQKNVISNLQYKKNPFKNLKCEKEEHWKSISKFILIGLIKITVKKFNNDLKIKNKILPKFL